MLNKVEKKENVDYLFFWEHTASKDDSVTQSCFSQWWHSAFVIDGLKYATAEHWMMMKKAELFNHTAMINRILAAKTPAEAKKLGRQVQNCRLHNHEF